MISCRAVQLNAHEQIRKSIALAPAWTSCRAMPRQLGASASVKGALAFW